MKFLLLLLLLINISFANSQNISRMNALKKVIQKEEYIALAINKYILQTGTIPKTNLNKLDWEKLDHEDYLGESFNKNNPLTSEDIDVYYDTQTYNFFIRGVVVDIGTEEEPESSYDEDLKYLYNFYKSRIFRVNTIAPLDTTEEKLKKGSQVLYSSIQKEIIKILSSSSDNTIKLDSQECEVSSYYYELKGKELTYKYCKTVDNPITVYQDSPIYVEDYTELEYIKAKIGDKAYAKKDGTWYEYYYQGDTNPPWVAVYLGTAISAADEDENIEDLILSYIPDAKDLVFRQDGGCMLANGDIFCWGNNKYKKAGIENYGQLDTSLSPDYVNTPVMLKVQIDDTTEINGITRYDKNWYNNPYRVKFEKMSMNSTNVCGISPIFSYSVDGIAKKIGGDLYCNGSISSTYFEDIEEEVKSTSILKKNRFFALGKDDKLNNDNEIYLQDIVMVEDTAAVLSESGDIYTFGRNYKGALGIGSDDKFIIENTPQKIDTDIIFEKIFALRDIKGFGAIDEDNYFWIWGERPNGTIYNEPTLLDTSKRFDKDAIFVNTNEFVLKGVDNVFYKTTEDNSISSLSEIPSSAISVSIYGDFYTYVNEDLELKGSANLLKCMQSNEIYECSDENKNIFALAIDKLNEKSNTINGKDFANFSNVSIFKLDSVIKEEFEDFEDISKIDISEETGWKVKNKSDDSEIVLDSFRTSYPPTNISAQDGPDDAERIDPSRILGIIKVGTEYVEKTYNLGIEYANNEVEVEFDFFEIDSWDYEKFNVELNGVNFIEDGFIHDDHEVFTDSSDTGIAVKNLVTVYTQTGENRKYNDEKYHYKLRHKLNSSGDLTVKFSTRLLVPPEPGASSDNANYNYLVQGLADESWGIDNVHVKVKETNKKFVCAMTGFASKSQMYCWGNTARSIPILSTSLYDMSKISTINKLFITQENEKKEKMSYSQFNSIGENDSEGNLFLKFPTYIGGFDYGFYFK